MHFDILVRINADLEALSIVPTCRQSHGEASDAAGSSSASEPPESTGFKPRSGAPGLQGHQPEAVINWLGTLADVDLHSSSSPVPIYFRIYLKSLHSYVPTGGPGVTVSREGICDPQQLRSEPWA
ncbi:hypothetical protein E4U58_006381 [Claviceps cyperi]|nr:hypothetical protein E4U58_006381 [Claviceps cyperi]